MKKLLSIVVLTGLTVALHAQNLLTNGSFELPALAFGTATNFSGAYSIPGWTGYSTGDGVTSSSGIVNSTDSLDGSQEFAFNGGNPAAGSYIQQSFATKVGAQYLVSYGVARFNDTNGQPIEMEMQVLDANTNSLVTAYTVPFPNAWVKVAKMFTATTTNTTVLFTDISASNPNTDLYLDAVSVVQVDDPAQIAVRTVNELELTGVVGATYQILSSPDLTTWTTNATIVLSRSPFIWIDRSVSAQAKYYKAITP